MTRATLATVAATLGLLMTATTATAQQEFETLDANDDSYLDADELAEWVDDEGIFTRWDVDGDSELDADNINESIYAIWDLDDDEVVSEAEWRTGTTYLYPDDIDPGAFGEWDLDGDSELDADEVVEGLDVTNWNEEWYTDADPVVGYDDFLDRFYTLWDLDDDGLLDTLEYHGGAAYWIF